MQRRLIPLVSVALPLAILGLSLVSEPTEADPLPFWADQTQSRADRVAKCASCHAAAFAEWKGDSHSRSQTGLHEHRSFVHSREDAPQFVKDRSNKNNCIVCHIPQDIFTEEFALGATGVAKARVRSLKEDHEPGKTGVDCMTCHLRAGALRVMTRENFKPSGKGAGSPDFCNPQPSAFFSSNGFCISCHAVGMKAANEPLGSPRSCQTCHEQRDASGKFNHHYFDHGDDPKLFASRPARLLPFHNVEASVDKDSDARLLKIQWTNTAPHALLQSPRQIILRAEVVDSGGSVRFTKSIRFTMKKFLEEAKNTSPGLDYAVLGANQTHRASFALPDEAPKSGNVRITFFRKEQYWMRDQEMTQLFEKSFPYGAP